MRDLPTTKADCGAAESPFKPAPNNLGEVRRSVPNKIVPRVNRRNLLVGAGASAVVAPVKAEDFETARFRDALERIAILDEADGHELTWKHASIAVGIASQTLGKHPSQIFEEREARHRTSKRGNGESDG